MPVLTSSGRGIAIALAVLLAIGALGFVAPRARGAPPTLVIVSPQDGAVIGNGSAVSVVFRVTDFNLTQPGGVGQIVSPNEGHVEVFVDGTLIAVVAELTVVLPLDSGAHSIRLRLVQSDGTPLVPETNATVSVTVTHGPAVGEPSISISFPPDSAERGADTAVSYRLENFALVAPGRSVAPNEGHIHVHVDGEFYAELTAYGPAHFSDLVDGDHTVRIQLVDSAHNPLDPDASDTVRFRVFGAHAIDLNPQLSAVIGVLAVAVLLVLIWRRRRPA